jgi:hypothetical protein
MIRLNAVHAMAVSSLLLLSACGGGGGGGNPNPPPPTDTTAPDTFITSGPPAETTSRSASFVLSSTEAGATFQARLDGGAFQVVTSPYNVTALADGSHTVTVRSVDAAGNVDASFVIYGWEVDGTAPTAQIQFPTPVSYTDAANLHVRGTALDARTISALTVNGVAATSTNSFRNWSAVVPINAGDTTITIGTTDSLGNTTANAATASVTNRGVSIASMDYVVSDPANDRLLVGDRIAKAVVAVDRASGIAQEFSGPRRGIGPSLQDTSRIALDSANGRLFVFDIIENRLVAVDLATGNRNVISPPDFSILVTGGLAWDGANNRILAGAGSRIVAIDATTGLRSVISGDGMGTGPTIQFPWRMTLDTSATPRLLVISSTQSAIYSVDLANGNRSYFSLAGANGSGPAINPVSNPVLDIAGNRALVASSRSMTEGSLVAVDLTSGNRTELLSNAGFQRATSIAFDVATSRVFLGVNERPRIQVVNMGTLGVTTLSHSNVGTGATMNQTRSLALDLSGTTPALYSVGVNPNGYVLRTDLTTGDRTLVSSFDTIGSGNNFNSPLMFALDTRAGAPARQGIVIDGIGGGSYQSYTVDLVTGNRTSIAPVLTFPSITAVGPFDGSRGRLLFAANTSTPSNVVGGIDPATGNTSTLSESPAGGGPTILALALDALPGAPTRVIAGTNGSVIAVNLDTGERDLLSGGSTGTGGRLLMNPLIAVHSTPRRAFLVSREDDAVQLVDLVTGNRSIVSGRNPEDASEAGAGPRLAGDTGGAYQAVAFDPTSSLLYFRTGDRLLAIDPVSGDRVICSR